MACCSIELGDLLLYIALWSIGVSALSFAAGVVRGMRS